MKLSIITGALMLAGYAVAVPMVLPSSFSEGNIAPLYVSDEAESLADSYIVVLKDHVNDSTMAQHTMWINNMSVRTNSFVEWLNGNQDNHGVRHVYNTPTLKGYSGKFDKEVLQQIRSSDEVAYVEKDSMVYASELQRGAPWGLARISHRKALDLRTFSKYQYEKEGGEGVKVFVIDTGINVRHVDFEGRAAWGKTIPSGDADEDGNGHGSHCAGTIAGKRFGVAKKAEPVAVKVLRSNGSGSMSDVVKGVDWATSEHLSMQKQAKESNKRYKGAVANMSLGGGKSPTLDNIVNGAVKAGMVFAVAAGNDNRDACNYSPARAELAITVGASTIGDERAYFSNYGSCVDVFAPGLNIKSIWNTNDHATNTISGTSMASPHTAGLAAYLLSFEEGNPTPKQIKDKIISMGTRDRLANIGKDSPNILIYNGIEED
ncbi:serine protease [Radiomyces spectabilis]|uniref:serine protease n=1 Tax=Radiomyces spectabilis TaxID=64574 RepID=UPI0022210505|nr:serine protease [Radiomyces spectabilis]KAI8379286.1 serine protease [Radiomyces spectabilis]